MERAPDGWDKERTGKVAAVGEASVARCARVWLAVGLIANILEYHSYSRMQLFTNTFGGNKLKTAAPHSFLRMRMSAPHSYSHSKTNRQIHDSRDSGSAPIESRALFIGVTKSFQCPMLRRRR